MAKILTRQAFEKSGAILDIAPMRSLKGRLPGILNETLVICAEEIRDKVKAAAPRDTGALAESVYISSRRYSDYDDAKRRADEVVAAAVHAQSTPNGHRPPLDWQMNEKITPDTERQISIAVGAPYGADIEYGHAMVPPRPFLRPVTVLYELLYPEKLAAAFNKACILSSAERKFK